MRHNYQLVDNHRRDIIMVGVTTLLPSTLFIFAVIVHATDVQSAGSAVCPAHVVSRLAWDAREPKSTTNFQSLPEFVVICHTATSACRDQTNCSAVVRAMQTYHMDRRHWDDIGYNFVIGEDGAVYVGRGWDQVGTHSVNYNDKSIAIALIGNFEARLPDQIALDAAKKLIECGVTKGKIPQEYKLVGHRQVSSTDSPGDKLFDEIKTWPRWVSKLD